MKVKSYEEKAINSMIWNFLERISSQFVSVAISIILARILFPEDYADVGLVTIFFAIAEVIVSGGFSSALIQKKDADDKDYSSVLWVSILVSGVVYCIFFFLAPVISSLYGRPDLVMLFRVMALVLPINAAKSVWTAKISSNMEFRKFFLSTIGGILISAVIGIYMAIKGHGAMALVAQQMTNAFFGTVILFFTTKIKIDFHIYWSRIKQLFGFGSKVLISSLIGKIYTELNPLVIGLKFNVTDLSYYAKGNSFPSKISAITNSTFSSVLLPLLTKYQDDKEVLLHRTRQFIRYATYLVFPIMLGFFAVAENFVIVLLTDKWLPVVPFIRIFCISQMFEMIHAGNCEAIKAMGRSDIFLKMEIIKKTLYFITIAIFVWFSNDPITLAYSMIICTCIAIVVNSIPNQYLLGYKVRFQFFDIVPNLLSSVLMCIGVIFVGELPFSAGAMLVIQVVAGAILYVALSLVTKNESFSFYCSMLKKKIMKGK